MKTDKFDIGAEVISILTRGMYPDPRDAVREYIQNSIDAGASEAEIKVRQNSVVVEDDGTGMDYKTLRKAIRVGISDKKPGKDVGFMGIGIYSSFHLCDTLFVFTKKEKKLPQYLKMDFKGMRGLLKEERDKRLSGEYQSEDLTDLQTLLEKYIELPEEGQVPLEEYPIKKSGTRIELVGLNPILDDLLNNFNDLSNYLQDVVPLPFHEKEKFKWGPTIQKKLKEAVESHHEKFELIKLRLQVGTQSEDLRRPYTDDIFFRGQPLQPEFIEIKNGANFLGITWACLNSENERIILPEKDEKKRNLRGLILKKQGFSIGNREMLSKYFGPSNTFYHRYTGEIIIVNKEILPNAARNDIESSDLKKLLILQIQERVAPTLSGIASKLQEHNRAKAVLDIETNRFNKVLGEYNPYEDNYNNYISQIGVLNEVVENIGKKVKKLSEQDKANADLIRKKAEELKKEITQKIEANNRSKKEKITSNKATQIAKDVAEVKTEIIETKYDSLIEMLIDMEFDISNEYYQLFELIDDKFIKGSAASKSQYYQFLKELKADFENGND